MFEAKTVESIVQHMNEDHADAVLAYVKAFGPAGLLTSGAMRGVDSDKVALLTDIDEEGIDVQCKVGGQSRVIRILYRDAGLPATMDSVDDARAFLIKMVRLAREKLPHD